MVSFRDDFTFGSFDDQVKHNDFIRENLMLNVFIHRDDLYEFSNMMDKAHSNFSMIHRTVGRSNTSGRVNLLIRRGSGRQMDRRTDAHSRICATACRPSATCRVSSSVRYGRVPVCGAGTDRPCLRSHGSSFVNDP